ncbi:hypothetical protein JQ615_36390 [Bradyrhizobium jicamae]|uniref:Uncharacterized protein n=1 Tax=Bradyrhizobium jicamae TaxID=280332 RepID=A0ABS5FVJ4_9BRAD|nr:hypothetical protein [Bradyrhizobium jicamae]MBR0800855.1 hypothetical protein [Bradyrhizobium jicamae]
MSVTRKPIDISPAAARQFVAELQAYHAQYDTNRRDEIAVRARHLLLEHMPKGSKLRLSEVKELDRLKTKK